MTTTPIPDAAVQAAAIELADIVRTLKITAIAVDNAGLDPANPAFGIADVEAARRMLTAAIPLLGEVTTEYTVRVTRDGRSHELDDCAHTSRGHAEVGAKRIRDHWTQTAVVSRTVVTGPWTEADEPATGIPSPATDHRGHHDRSP